MAVCLAGGCEKPSTSSEYSVVDGTVEGLRADTFELTVRAGEHWPGMAPDSIISCLLTKDAEIYVNDRFSGFDAIAVGDDVELIGYPEPNRRGERFVVATASIRRAEPLPDPPDLSPPATQPAAPPPQEN